YTTANVGTDPLHHGQFYSTTPGPYDIWAIEFGYTPSMDNPEDEKERVNTLLKKSTKNEYGYGNDADDMRSPGKGIDPRIMVSDMSDDPVAYAQQRMDIIRSLYPGLKKKFEKTGQSYHGFTDAFSILNREYGNSARVISRYIGGVYMDRSMVGQEGREKPFISVPKDRQKWAMTLLGNYVFSPDAYEIPEDIFTHLQWERRGWSGTRDPKILDMFLNTQNDILNHLLHINVLKRISDTELYGNNYSLNEMMEDLTTTCFSADAGSNVNSMRRNLQAEYTKRVIQIVLNKGKVKYDHISVSAAFENLHKIKKHVSKVSGVDDATKSHRKYLSYSIDKALDT
ncbi:MAG: zinc-dependent metalloprotease, partial [Candidatus Marinimicrobia bacterium]|nr:zinc-dependent metalloprotease [Candidatus Neomarinimicrobiota bacterium]